MKKVLYVVGIVFVLCVGIIGGYAYGTGQAPLFSNIPASSIQTASVMLDYGDGKIQTFRNIVPAENETIFALLQKTAQTNNLAFEYKEYKDLGMLITRIGTKTNGEQNKYWQYWVNNESPQIGADKYIATPGLVIEWKFIAYSNE